MFRSRLSKLLLLAVVFYSCLFSTVDGYDNAKTATKIMKHYKTAAGNDIKKESSTTKTTKATKEYGFPAATATEVEDRGTSALGRKQAVEPHKAFFGLVTNIRDEVVDIFDAVVYAESHEERFENIVDIAVRHRGVLGTVALGMALKTAISPEINAKSGSIARAKLRDAEIAKWGTRMAK